MMARSTKRTKKRSDRRKRELNKKTNMEKKK